MLVLGSIDVSKILFEDTGKHVFDFVFLDHDKNCYLPDLQRLENRSLLSGKCTLVADNGK